MLQELKFQLSTAILTIVTIAAGVSAIINFQQQHKFRLPEDNVVWVDRAGGVRALYVKPGGQGEKAGLRTGDRLVKIGGVEIGEAIHVPQVLVTVGPWSKTDYLLERRGIEFKATVVVGQSPPDRAISYQYLLGAVYLLIGLFVYFRRSEERRVG